MTPLYDQVAIWGAILLKPAVTQASHSSRIFGSNQAGIVANLSKIRLLRSFQISYETNRNSASKPL